MTYSAADIKGTLWLIEPEPRGSKVMIRRKAPHYTGNGDIIARQLELSDAQFICQLLNAASQWSVEFGSGEPPHVA
jgi:hypothetical protein